MKKSKAFLRSNQNAKLDSIIERKIKQLMFKRSLSNDRDLKQMLLQMSKENLNRTLKEFGLWGDFDHGSHKTPQNYFSTSNQIINDAVKHIIRTLIGKL